MDLKPFLANTRTAIDKTVSSAGKADGVDVSATVTGTVLGIEYGKSLRIVAEADGAARVTVSKLP